MGPVMYAHVNQFFGFGRSAECRLHDGPRFTHEGNDRPVRGLSRVYVEDFHPFY